MPNHPAETEGSDHNGVWTLFDGFSNIVLDVASALLRGLYRVRSSVSGLAIQILSRAHGLVRFAFHFPADVSDGLAEAFLDFATDVFAVPLIDCRP